jgi:hypothetical protein
MAFLARFMKIAALATAALLGACGGGGGSSGGGGGGGIVDAGILKLALTDAPACNFNQVNVTVQKVRVHQSSTAAAGDTGWSEIVLAPAQRVDLLSLMNGVVLELGQQTVPVGTYHQLSLVLASNDATTPLANAVTPVAQTERALGSAPNLQSALTIPVSITVVKDQVTDYVIDFDACNSVLRLGSTGNYQLSPKLSVVQRLSATGQRVTGYVDATALDPATTRVSLQAADGTIVRATNPDSSGRFVLYPVPAGTYNLVVSSLGFVPAVVTGVPASDAASTDINTAATPILPPTSPGTHTINGTVSTGTTPVDARITIVKKYAGGPDVTVAGAPADANTGALLYTVATAAPVKAPYVANTQPVFSPDNTAPGGRYTVTATVGGVTKTVDVDATTNDPVADFTFP